MGNSQNKYIGNIRSIKTNNFLYFFDTITGNIFMSSPELDWIINYCNKNEILKLNWSESEIVALCKKNKFNKAKILNEINRLQFLIKNKFILLSSKQFHFFNKINKQVIDFNIANTQQLVIQTTEKCNLKCKYCIDGNLYRNADDNCKSDMDPDNCLLFIKYILELFNSKMNFSQNKKLIISFYGGEPLLNFNLIKFIINYIESQKIDNIIFQYSLTTNGVLLDKYSSYLVEKNFLMSISLDGNPINNQYRIFNNGDDSFNIIFKNIINLKNKYPSYFNENVSFLSVYHDKNNNIYDLYDYFIKNFHKIPRISPLVLDEIANSQEEIKSIYREVSVDIATIKKIKYKGKNLYDPNFNIVTVESRLFSKAYSSFEDFFNIERKANFPSGTCYPFINRIYLTVKGYLYSCEKVNPKFIFGKFENGKIKIFYDEIINYYNDLTNTCQKVCGSCFNKSRCDICFFCNSENFLNTCNDCYTTIDKLTYKAKRFLETNEFGIAKK
jgi:uncharacterized protein